MRKLVFLIVILTGIFWLATTKTGTSWGDDWALYVHHAKNITQGIPYGDVGYIYNENYTTYSPKIYPPGFPLILAPFYAAGGINLALLKIPVILSFIISIFFLISYFKRISPITLVIVIALLGMNPFLWSSKDFILSDIPFTLMIIVCQWLMNKYYQRIAPSSPALIAMGIAIYFAGSIRVLGVLLIPTLFIYDLSVEKRITKKFLIVFLTFIICSALQLSLTGSDSSYLNMFTEYQKLNLNEIESQLIFHVEYYIRYFSDFWLINHEQFDFALFAGRFTKFFLISALAGFCVRAWRKLSPLEIFMMLYTSVIFVYPAIQGARFFIPLFPFLLVFAFQLPDNMRSRYARFAFHAALLVPILFFYWSAYRTVEWKNIAYGIHEKNAQDLFDYVKSNTAGDAVFVLSKPRAFSLYTDRRAAVFHSVDQPNELLDYWKSIKADYIVTGIIDVNDYFEKMAVNDSTNFTMAYSNEWFKVFKINF